MKLEQLHPGWLTFQGLGKFWLMDEQIRQIHIASPNNFEIVLGRVETYWVICKGDRRWGLRFVAQLHDEKKAAVRGRKRA